MTKGDPIGSFLSKLRQLLKAAERYSNEDFRKTTGREIDHVIEVLSNVRKALNDEPLQSKSIATVASIGQLLEFLEDAKSNDAFQVILSEIVKSGPATVLKQKPKREPVVIAPHLNNQQVRELLQQDLSKAELKQLAEQRSISVGKRSSQELRAAIRSFIDKQESYQLLRS